MTPFLFLFLSGDPFCCSGVIESKFKAIPFWVSREIISHARGQESCLTTFKQGVAYHDLPGRRMSFDKRFELCKVDPTQVIAVAQIHCPTLEVLFGER